MCGIAGIAHHDAGGISVAPLARMGAAIRHRGPDGYGFYTGAHVGFAHLRLSIVDLEGGAQPLTNEDGTMVITFNGEVYNHPELRRELAGRGHAFRTRSDTEVLVHAYEEWGPDMLRRLNGQFAFAIYNAANRSLFFARDRFGVRPFFYAMRGSSLYFASEIKAILASGEVNASVDPVALDEVFTLWAARPPRTGFEGIAALEPGTFGLWQHGRVRTQRYYEIDFPEEPREPADAVEQLDELMRESVSLRLRADVPVGAYLSGGLDSSITATLAAAASPHQLRSFSIAFEDPRYDESAFQREVAAAVGSRHAVAHIGAEEIAEVFPSVVWHTETPVLRTAPAPMYRLAALTRHAGIKVVLTGEGADELFLGYDLFKEMSVRRFCLRQPQSTVRPRLFDRLYPYLAGQQGRTGDFWRRFFLDAGPVSDPLFSHLPRIALTSWIREFYAPAFAASLQGSDVLGELRAGLPARFFGWSPLNQAAFLEMQLLLSPYLLSSQGDRMAMAHGVEGRFPFLDHRLFEFAAALPTGARLRGLHEKEILRRWGRRILPPAVGERTKQPYRAPDAPSFFGPRAPAWVQDLLSDAAIAGTGMFAPRAVAGLVGRCRAGKATSVRENQALLGILSSQLWHQQFLARPVVVQPLDVGAADVHVHDAVPVAA